MAKKPLTPEEKAERKLARHEALSYGAGALPANLNTQIKNSYHMAFLTEVVGLDPLLIGMFNTALTIWDAINDILIGSWADRTNTRFGKYRPHMMWGIVAWTVITILMFLVPGIGTTGQTVYYVALLFVWSVACTAFVVPWQSLNSAMSSSVDQRNTMLMLRQVVGSVAATALLMVAPIYIKANPGAKGYQIPVLICLAISLVGGAISIYGARHKDYKGSIPTPPKVNFNGILKLFKSKPVLCVALMLGCIYLTTGIGTASSLYYFKYVVGDLTLMSLTSLFSLVATLFIIPTVPLLYKKFGRVQIYVVSTVLIIVSFLPKIIMREHITAIVLIVTSFLQACSISVTNMTVLAFVPDCVDYSELTTGSPNAGQISALASFMKKFMNSFSTTIIGVALTVGGYVNEATVTSPGLITSIIVGTAVVPVLLAVAGLVTMKFFPIKGEFAVQMRKELAERRAQRSAETK